MKPPGRALSPGEAALWRRVARHTKPRPGKALPAEPPPVEAKPPIRTKAKAKPEAPAPPPPATRPRAAASGPANRAGERRVQRGRVDIVARIDLHGHTQDQARGALLRFLSAQQEAGARTVLVITGKSGVLRVRLRDWLAAAEFRARVSGYAEAHRRHGGEGAWYVFLKRA